MAKPKARNRASQTRGHAPICCALLAFCACDTMSDSDWNPFGGPARRDVQELILRPADSHAYEPAVAAGDDAFLVSWTEYWLRAGDATDRPDIIYQRVPPLFEPLEGLAPTALTPYAEAQLNPRPFSSDLGFGIAWADDAVSGSRDRRILWHLLDDGPSVPRIEDARPTTNDRDRQWNAAVAALGSRALVVYLAARDGPASTISERRASLIDLEGNTILVELDLGEGSADFYSVTAGASAFLVSWLVWRSTGRYELSACIVDADGDLVWGPETVAPDLPVRARRWSAGYHDGVFLLPTAEYEVVTVDRPCCLICPMEQPPTCTFRDYRLTIQAIAEHGGPVGGPQCLDCRVDVGLNTPLVASDATGAYFFWTDYLGNEIVARVRSDETPPGEHAWKFLEFPEYVDAAPLRSHSGLAALNGQLALVGRLSDPLSDDYRMSVFVARFEY
jgi:hypothetical protein